MENKIIFYSTKCPKCKVLEAKLKQKHIDYVEINDIDEMLKRGVKSAPCLDVNNKILLFGEAIDYVNGR